MNAKLTLPYSRIEKLEKALRNIARTFTQDALEADDLYQDIALRLLQMHPDTTDSGLLLKARWLGCDHLKRAGTYIGHVLPQDEILLQAKYHARCQKEIKDTDVIWEAVGSKDDPIEDQLIQKEQRAAIMLAISKLPKKHQGVIRMLAAGKKPVEIAEAEGVSKSAISQRIAQIAIELKITIKY
jgi:RNA polymerase sigma factor (sigma-70 family)